jgi:hypothetical protein
MTALMQFLESAGILLVGLLARLRSTRSGRAAPSSRAWPGGGPRANGEAPQALTGERWKAVVERFLNVA